MARESLALARTVAAQFHEPASRFEALTSAPVVVIPGFMSSDFTTGVLRRTLRFSGVRVAGWGEGVNSGLTAAKLDRVARRIDRLARASGEKVVLIGWSHGGFYARELARRRPDQVAMMITLGTPFAYWRRVLDSREGRALAGRGSYPMTPPVYTIACWSHRDGLVDPVSAAGGDGEVHERVQLACTHNEMTRDPEALRTIAALLQRGPARAG